MIELLEVTCYPREPGSYWTEKFPDPAWRMVESHVRQMHPYERPLLTLQRHRDVPDSELLMINGGNDLFHVQVADADAYWSQAFDPDGSEEQVQVWLSDQGFATARRFTWGLIDALTLLRHYFETGSKHHGYHWD